MTVELAIFPTVVRPGRPSAFPKSTLVAQLRNHLSEFLALNSGDRLPFFRITETGFLALRKPLDGLANLSREERRPYAGA